MNWTWGIAMGTTWWVEHRNTGVQRMWIDDARAFATRVAALEAAGESGEVVLVEAATARPIIRRSLGVGQSEPTGANLFGASRPL